MTEYDYDQHLVAFFDILGFKEIIARADSAEQVSQQIRDFNDALLTARQIFEKHWGTEVDVFTVKMFSDCICASVPAKHENVEGFLQSVTYVQSAFAYNRIMLRGGVTIGRHFINDQLIFSEALVEAYKIEMKTKHPRIAVSEKLREFVSPTEELPFGEDPESQLRLNNAASFWHARTFHLRHDPVLFLDYLNFSPSEGRMESTLAHRDWIIWGLEEHRGDDAVRPKFEWLRMYHNQWCSIYEKHRDDLNELLVDESHV